MKYIKTFDTETNYEAYRDDKSKYLKPNVSLCDDKGKVHYNYPKWDTADKPFVDLGLPSGTLWATCNVGASKPSDAGQYFQWGDTVGYTADQVGTGDGQKKFSWADYKWNPNRDGKTFTKYNTTGATLELEDDAAHVNMGGDWHMPSPDQIRELINTANTTNTWTTQDGVNGRLFTSKKNGKSIFVPAAGSAWDGSLDNSGSYGYVWSSTLLTNYVNGGQNLYFNSSNVYLFGSNRNYGFSVRGVLG